MFAFLLLINPAFASASITDSLTLGSKGSQVIELQEFLRAHNYFSASPTGYFGKLTKDAVIEFQKDFFINPSFGYVGAVTAYAINRNKLKSTTDTQSDTSGNAGNSKK